MLRERYQWGPNPKPFTIAEAVEKECQESFDTRGSAECANERAQNNTILLGRLLTKLHEKNILDIIDVADVLGSSWKAIADERAD